MAVDATLRHDYAERRLKQWLSAQVLTGSPSVFRSDTPKLPAVTSPQIRLTFRPLDPVRMGRFDATRSALRMATLWLLDIWWPDGEDGGTFNAFSPHVVWSELQNGLQDLALSFQDYTIPTAPVDVTPAAYITITQPVRLSTLPGAGGKRRSQIRAVAEWVGRSEDRFA